MKFTILANNIHQGPSINRYQRIRHKITALLLSFALTACSAPLTLEEDKVGHTGLFSLQSQGLRPLLLVGDNQFHNQYTDPSHFASTLSDRFAKVAIRPVQLNLFAPDLLAYILRKENSQSVLIHLGDALNIASTIEWKRFVDVLSDQKNGSRPWVMLPGNHDTYLYGNTAGKSNADEGRKGMERWYDAAKGDGTKWHPGDTEATGLPMTKDLWLKKYLASLVAQRSLWPAAFPQNKEGESFHARGCVNHDSDRSSRLGCWKNPNSTFITRLHWYYDDSLDNYFQSYLVQEIRLSLPSASQVVRGILLDTTNYSKRPSTRAGSLGSFFGWGSKLNAGLTGEISSEQWQIAADWIKQYKQDYYLFGHHPFSSLTPDSQKIIIDAVGDDPKFRGYISAHTHDPTAYHCKENTGKVQEFNIGSITDWPPQYAIVSGDDGLRRKLLADLVVDIEFNCYDGHDSLRSYTSYRGANTPSGTRDQALAVLYVAYLDLFEKGYNIVDGHSEGLRQDDQLRLRTLDTKAHRLLESEDPGALIQAKTDVPFLRKLERIDASLRLLQQNARLNYGLREAFCASREEALH